MGLKAVIGVLSCPDCGGHLLYSGVEQIEIYDAQCLNCQKLWRVVRHPGGRTEVRERIES